MSEKAPGLMSKHEQEFNDALHLAYGVGMLSKSYEGDVLRESIGNDGVAVLSDTDASYFDSGTYLDRRVHYDAGRATEDGVVKTYKTSLNYDIDAKGGLSKAPNIDPVVLIEKRGGGQVLESRLTGERAKRAHEIIVARAARGIGTIALDRADAIKERADKLRTHHS